jgi:hypothetical protein
MARLFKFLCFPAVGYSAHNKNIEMFFFTKLSFDSIDGGTTDHVTHGFLDGVPLTEVSTI